MALIEFDASGVSMTPREPVAPGTYEAVVADSEIRPTRSGAGEGLNLTFEIVSGEQKGRKVWTWINIRHPNPTAQKIGEEELARLCFAVGVTRLSDTAQLHDRPLMITVAIDRDDPTRNVVRGYRAKEGVAAASAGGAPWKR